MNVAYRLFVSDNSTVPPSVHPTVTPDPRILSDSGPEATGGTTLGTNQLWVWQG
jgi:hypothetical protein